MTQDTQDKRAEAGSPLDCLNALAIMVGVDDHMGQFWIKTIRAALSAKPDADIIGKMEGVKSNLDTRKEGEIYEHAKTWNAAIDQCIALVKQGLKVG